PTITYLATNSKWPARKLSASVRRRAPPTDGGHSRYHSGIPSALKALGPTPSGLIRKRKGDLRSRVTRLNVHLSVDLSNSLPHTLEAHAGPAILYHGELSCGNALALVFDHQFDLVPLDS